MYRRLFKRLGVVAFECVEPGVDLFIVGFWRLFVVAVSPRNRWIKIVRCERSPLEPVEEK